MLGILASTNRSPPFRATASLRSPGTKTPVPSRERYCKFSSNMRAGIASSLTVRFPDKSRCHNLCFKATMWNTLKKPHDVVDSRRHQDARQTLRSQYQYTPEQAPRAGEVVVYEQEQSRSASVLHERKCLEMLKPPWLAKYYGRGGFISLLEGEVRFVPRKISPRGRSNSLTPRIAGPTSRWRNSAS